MHQQATLERMAWIKDLGAQLPGIKCTFKIMILESLLTYDLKEPETPISPIAKAVQSVRRCGCTLNSSHEK